MKKFGLLILSLGMALILVACGNGGSRTSSSSSSSTGSTSSTSSSSQTTKAEPGKKVLVAYFSASGNTESVAQDIAQTTGGDLFQLEPAQSFTDDDLNWTNDNSRVVREYENPSERTTALAKDAPDNWDDYDTVFIGYPLWWQQAAWPINDFITNNNFDGKTVIPFATSMSSPMRDSGSNLAMMAGTGNWQEGRRFSQSGNSTEVADWLKELGY